VRAASPDLFRAVRADLASGRFIDGGHSARAERVAILGPDAARRLGIAGVERLPAIYVGDELYLVIGILRDVVRKPELLGSVIIPEGTARRHFSLFGPGMVVVETKIGAASLIALQAGRRCGRTTRACFACNCRRSRGACVMTCKPISI
jgi:macrolide transport system ATP-binding/permease protein